MNPRLWPSGVRAAAAALVAIGACALFCAAATAAKPTRAGHYYGFQADESSASTFLDVSAELRVSYSGRRLEPGSYVHLTAECPGSRISRDVKVSLGRAVRISRRGRFTAAGTARRLRYRLEGRFLNSQYARITYTLRPRHRRRPCQAPRYPVALYLDGERPFSGCRSQKATTISSSVDGRVFEQYRLAFGQFWPYDYACLYDGTGAPAVLLGRNYDDEQVSNAQVRGAYVAYASVGCGVSNCSAAIVEKYLPFGGGTVKAAPSVFGSRTTAEGVGSLVLKANGSVAWITIRSATLGGIGPVVPAHSEVYAFDQQGWRMLDSGQGIVPDSLRLDEPSSTVSWVNGGATKTETLH
jgi:hypothetical protein